MIKITPELLRTIESSTQQQTEESISKAEKESEKRCINCDNYDKPITEKPCCICEMKQEARLTKRKTSLSD